MILLIAAVICVMIGFVIILSNCDIENDVNPEFYNDDNDNRRL